MKAEGPPRTSGARARPKARRLPQGRSSWTGPCRRPWTGRSPGSLSGPGTGGVGWGGGPRIPRGPRGAAGPGGPAGAACARRVRGYRAREDVTVQAPPPPATWNTRITVNSVANQVFTYTLMPAEYNGGRPSLPFGDAVPPPAAAASEPFLPWTTIPTPPPTSSPHVPPNINRVMPQPNPSHLVK